MSTFKVIAPAHTDRVASPVVLGMGLPADSGESRAQAERAQRLLGAMPWVAQAGACAGWLEGELTGQGAREVSTPAGPVTLLYEDEDILAFDKPSGLHCVPGKGPDKQDCLSGRVQSLYPQARIVHRLDLDTSGIVLMARGLDMQRIVNRCFETRQVDKRYVARVLWSTSEHLSVPTDAPWALIDLPIALDWERRPLHVVDHIQGRPSQTRWQVLHTENLAHESTALASAWVLLEPITGRSHQLRVHMQAMGHPMLGDRLYAHGAARECVPRLMLHATQLRLPHPRSGQSVLIESTVPFAA